LISYTDSLEGITPSMLIGGFWNGWPNPPSPKTHLKILHGSYRVVLAVDDEKGMVVGFVNAISDGVHVAFIPYLEVLKEYQERGIGSKLMRRMIDSLQDMYAIDLVCDEDVQPFYDRLGFQRARAMSVRNFDRQSGG
jgi:ribosomal protein S18 acetylase RimI-like enzyme